MRIQYDLGVYNVTVADNKIAPQFVRKSTGDSVKFHCYSDGDTTWLYEYNKVLPPGVKITLNNKSLVISDIQEYHHGRYACHGYDSDKQRYFLDGAGLSVRGKSII